MKRILLTAISIGATLLLLFLIIGSSSSKDLDERADEALEYCEENGYSTEYCLLVDYGKDKTNSNALQRGILIHPVSLPNFSIYPLLIPVKVHKILGHKIRPKSEGCITIPFRKYSKVVETVESSSKPLMLWVYE